MLINLNAPPKNFRRLLFPDNQPHIQLEGVIKHSGVDVVCSLIDSKRVLELLMLSNALDNNFCKKERLFIPYLMGARFDRVMQPGDSFDLKVIANLINSMNFEQVILFDPHSDVAPALINNVVVVTNEFLVQAYDKPDSVLIIPDAGAAKKASNYPKWNKNITSVIQCDKHRNVTDGSLTLSIPGIALTADRDCVVIDDLCDGGGTFQMIADELTFPNGEKTYKSLTLIVTHGIFSKGITGLEKYFDQIITSDSYRSATYSTDDFKVIKCPIA